MKNEKIYHLLMPIIAAILLLFPASANAATASLPITSKNTYNYNTDTIGWPNNCYGGDYAGGMVCVVQFDWSAIPADATINSAQYTFNTSPISEGDACTFAFNVVPNNTTGIPNWSPSNSNCDLNLYTLNSNSPYTFTSIQRGSAIAWASYLWNFNGSGQVLSQSLVVDYTPAASAPPSTYTPDGQVLGAATGLMGSLVTTYLQMIPTALLIVGALIVTLFGIRKLIGWVRGNMHG